MEIGLGLALVRRAATSGGSHERTAFVTPGFGNGSLNNELDPFPSIEAASVALAAAYPGQDVNIRLMGDANESALPNLWAGLTHVRIIAHGAPRRWDWASFNYAGAAGAEGQDGAPGGGVEITFDGITSSGTLYIHGGTGGAYYPGSQSAPGHAGGAGGGPVNLINGTTIAHIEAQGGDGGPGQAGDESNPGGAGGNGGPGGTINHDATSSATSYNVSGGAGGPGGADGGAGGGADGTAGAPGSYNLI